MSYLKSDQTKTKKKKKRKVRTESQKLEVKLDKLASKVCRQQGYCTVCKKENCRLNAHHFKSRIYKNTRWYLPNLICLCVHCHTFNHKFSAHKTTEKFKDKMREIKGDEWADDIVKRANEPARFTAFKLRGLFNYYTGLIKE